jgi:alkyl sulfatase BDS1-like metallo-beta-lactamase superfamily hydrolase
MGAQELRQGPPKPASSAVRARGLLLAMTVEQVFDALAVRLKSEAVAGVSMAVNWTFPDVAEQWVLELSNRTLHATKGRHADGAAATITLDRVTFIDVITQSTTFMDAIAAGLVTIDGDGAALLTVFGNLETVQTGFAIVEP